MEKTNYEIRKERLEKNGGLSWGVRPLTITEFEHYIITKDGRIFNTLNSKGNILDIPVEIKTHLNKSTGYKQTTLQNKKLGVKPKTFYVHRLVAQTYLIKPSDKHNEVNHKNLNKVDNRLENLEWVTRSENKKHLINSIGAKSTVPKVKYILEKNTKLLRVGLKVYSITQNVKDVADVWDCSEGVAFEVLKENSIPIIGKVKLPEIQKNALIEDIKEQRDKQAKKGLKIIFSQEFIKEIEQKYHTHFSRWYLDRIKNIALK